MPVRRSVRTRYPSDHGQPAGPVLASGPWAGSPRSGGRRERGPASSGPRGRGGGRGVPRCDEVRLRLPDRGGVDRWCGPRLVRRGPGRAAVQRTGRPRPEGRRGDRRGLARRAGLPRAPPCDPQPSVRPLVGGPPRRRLRAQHRRARAVHVPHRSGRADHAGATGHLRAARHRRRRPGRPRGGRCRRAGARRRVRGAGGALRAAHVTRAARPTRDDRVPRPRPTASPVRPAWAP